MTIRTIRYQEKNAISDFLIDIQGRHVILNFLQLPSRLGTQTVNTNHYTK